MMTTTGTGLWPIYQTKSLNQPLQKPGPLLVITFQSYTFFINSLVPSMARSQHLGITGCGVHFQKGGCDFTAIHDLFEKDRTSLQSQLFPAQMTARAVKPRTTVVVQNGGWGDLRKKF